MPYIPRTEDEILKELVSAVVVQTDLTDVEEGGRFATLLGAIAEQLAAIEFRLKTLRDAFDLDNASGADLDERVRELPGDSIIRLGPSSASAPAMQFTRIDTAAPLTVAAGVVVARLDDPSITYTTLEEFTFGIGEATYPPDPATPAVLIVCNIPGTVGNAETASITRLLTGPPEIIQVSNINPLYGRDRETDEEFRSRAIDYLSSLARCQPKAIETLARGYISDDGIRLLHANIYEDASRPAYSELMIDDGFGLQGLEVSGQVASGQIIDAITSFLYFQSPATEPITSIKINSVVTDINGPSGPRWVSLEERGVLAILDQSFISPGDLWTIDGYKVYTGIVRELQREIEGDPTDPANEPGWRAAGTRVRVLPPVVEYVDIKINLAIEDNANFEELVSLMIDETIAFVQQLGPGEPLFLAKLTAHLCSQFSDIKNMSIETPTADKSPANPRSVLRTKKVEVV
jgi:hypothetical protein